MVDAFASTLPGPPALEPDLQAGFDGIAAPLLRSLGAVAGLLP